LSLDAVSGNLSLSSTNASFNTVIIPVPAASLTLNLGFGTDSLAVADLSGLTAFDLVVNDTADVTLTSDVRLNGSLAVNAGEDIVVVDNATIDVGGDITLKVDASYALTWAAITPVFQSLNALGSIDIGDNVRLDGRNITLGVVAEAQIEVVRLVTGTPTITFADNGAAADTIARSTGSFIADGFKVGQSVVVRGTADGADAGTDPDNDGEFLIASLDASTITLQPSDTLIDQSQTSAVGTTGIKVYVQGSPGDMPLAVIDPNVTLDGHIPLVFANAGTADTITRSSGSWLADGFAVGQEVVIVGTALNNGAFHIAGLSATVMTPGATDKSLVNESTSRADITSVNSAGVGEGATSQDATTVEVTFSGNSITRTSGTWATGFAPGDELQVRLGQQR
jgi:hypothetical protein